MNRYLLLIGTLLSTQAHALDRCIPSAEDPQVRVCEYSPLQRYAVSGIVGFPVNLQVSPDERIKRFELAYTGQAKDGTPAPTWRGPAPKGDGALPAERFQNNLPLWPFQAGHSGLVLITALPDHTERSYQFDLVAAPAGTEEDRLTTAALVFKYSTDADIAAKKAATEKKQQAVTAWLERQAKVKEAQGIARLKTDVFYGVRNWQYQAKAETRYKALSPSEVSDNGWLTEFQWPGNIQAPTISILDPATGDERAAAVTQQGDMFIVNTTAEWWRLRLGHDAVMDVHNLGWNPDRPDPKTGTTSPDVIRTVMYRDQQK